MNYALQWLSEVVLNPAKISHALEFPKLGRSEYSTKTQSCFVNLVKASSDMSQH